MHPLAWHPAYRPHVAGDPAEYPVGYAVGYAVGASPEALLEAPYGVSGPGMLLAGDPDTLDIGAAHGVAPIADRSAQPHCGARRIGDKSDYAINSGASATAHAAVRRRTPKAPRTRDERVARN